MRAGHLDREITIQTFNAEGADEYGTPAEAWTDLAAMRAQLIQANTDEYLRAYGEGAATAVIFRTRWLDGVTTEHRVVYDGRNLNIREIREIGRRNGLELRCEEVRS